MAHVTNFSSNTSDHKTDHYPSNSNNNDSSVRVVLFKECKFKERQLLFDSLSPTDATCKESTNYELLKCSSNILQPYAKPKDEFHHLTEMIFGSTAMRYHGTYFKIHSISSPERIVITQVFVTPYKKRLKKSVSTSKNLLHSFSNLNEWDPTNEENSIMSMSDKFSNISLESSISIFRKDSSSTTRSHPSATDSGFSEQSSYSSFGTVSQFNSSRSLERFPSLSSGLESSTSLNAKDIPQNRSDCYTKSSLSYSRLGLAIIIAVTTEKNKFQNFIMNHISFIESILWRIRQYIEYTSNIPRCFLSYTFDITHESTQWIRDLSRDFNLIDRYWKRDRNDTTNNILSSTIDPKELSLFSKFSKIVTGKFEALKSRIKQNKFDRSCRLIQKLDTKENSFFMSTLLTAVLMNYLGWISTCYDLDSKDTVILRNSYNALWCQLRDLYGMTGISRSSRIILYNSNKCVIKETLDFIRYFIRYFHVEKRELERDNVSEESEVVNDVVSRGYVDVDTECLKCEEITTFSKRKSLNRSKTFTTNLAELVIEKSLDVVPEEQSVIFILGDDEKLVDLRRDNNLLTNDTRSLETKTSTDSTSNFCETKEQKKEKQDEHEPQMKVIKFPLPKVRIAEDYKETIPYEFSLENNNMDRFEPAFILQCTVAPEQIWKSKLKYDLSSSHSYMVDNSLEETVAILGDINKSKVQMLSSKKLSVLRTSNETVDTSQLVADMLDVTHQMWTLGIPEQYCTTHIEHRLAEICLKANAVAQLLLSSNFCTMDILVSTLGITISDIPLLMSVASSLCPEITKKYGVSYQ